MVQPNATEVWYTAGFLLLKKMVLCDYGEVFLNYEMMNSVFTQHNKILGSVSNLIRSWSSGLALAGFTFLEDIAFEHIALQSCRTHWAV